MKIVVLWILLVATVVAQAAEVVRTEANNGNLLMEDVPAVPQAVVSDLNRFQNVRSASVLDWTEDGQSLYIKTRFAEVSQIHRVDMPRGARHQLTFFKEPVGSVVRRPGHAELLLPETQEGRSFHSCLRLTRIMARREC